MTETEKCRDLDKFEIKLKKKTFFTVLMSLLVVITVGMNCKDIHTKTLQPFPCPWTQPFPSKIFLNNLPHPIIDSIKLHL